jgi:hypothetical protein
MKPTITTTLHLDRKTHAVIRHLAVLHGVSFRQEVQHILADHCTNGRVPDVKEAQRRASVDLRMQARRAAPQASELRS